MKSSFKISENVCVCGYSLSRHRGPENKPSTLTTSLTGYTLSSSHHNLISASRQGTKENPAPNIAEVTLRNVRSRDLRTLRSGGGAETSKLFGAETSELFGARPPNSSERGLRTVRKWVSNECGG